MLCQKNLHYRSGLLIWYMNYVLFSCRLKYYNVTLNYNIPHYNTTKRQSIWTISMQDNCTITVISNVKVISRGGLIKKAKHMTENAISITIYAK